MADDKNTLELISSITEFNDLHEYMADDQLDKALAIVVKLLMNPDVPSAKAPYLIIELQAMSTKFSMMASYYSTIAKDKAGTQNNNKKNIYYSANTQIHTGSIHLNWYVSRNLFYFNQNTFKSI